jgi:hypothetical protein
MATKKKSETIPSHQRDKILENAKEGGVAVEIDGVIVLEGKRPAVRMKSIPEKPNILISCE